MNSNLTAKSEQLSALMASYRAAFREWVTANGKLGARNPAVEENRAESFAENGARDRAAAAAAAYSDARNQLTEALLEDRN